MSEPITIGLSKEAHGYLQQLKDDGPFLEMTDAYRFGISLALAHGAIYNVISGRQTFLNVGSFDPDGTLKIAVRAFRLDSCQEEPVYSSAERLAEWGVRELWNRFQATGFLSLGQLFEEIEQLAKRD